MGRLFAAISLALVFQVASATPVPKQREEPTWFDKCQIGDWAEYSITTSDGWKGTEKFVITEKDGRTVTYSISTAMKSTDSAARDYKGRKWVRRGPNEFSWMAAIQHDSEATLMGSGSEKVGTYDAEWESYKKSWEQHENTPVGENVTTIYGVYKVYTSRSAPFNGVLKLEYTHSDDNVTTTKELIASGR